MPALRVIAGPNGCGTSTPTRTTSFRRIEASPNDAIAGNTMAGFPAWAARDVPLYDDTDTARSHCAAAMLREGAWWTAERLPIYGAASIARVTTQDH